MEADVAFLVEIFRWAYQHKDVRIIEATDVRINGTPLDDLLPEFVAWKNEMHQQMINRGAR